MADTVKSLDRWTIYLKEDGNVKCIKYGSVNIPVSNIAINYSPLHKQAIITIDIHKFDIKNFPGNSVEGKE